MAQFVSRSITFTIPAKNGYAVQITAVENAGNLDFTADVLGKPSTGLEKLFFSLVDASDLGFLKVLDANGLITGTQSHANGTINLGQGGIPFSVPGKGSKEVAGPVHFTLDATHDLTLDDIAHVSFGALLSKFGDKFTFRAPAAPDAKDDIFGGAPNKIFEDGASGLDSPSTTPVPVPLAVLANDTNAGAGLTITGFNVNPSHGTVAIAPDGKTALYTPTKDFSGTDSFVYIISDGHGGTDFATATVTLEAVADVPNLTYQILQGSTPYQTVVRVTATQTDADNSEFIDQIALSGIPSSVSVSDGGVWNPSGQPLSLEHDFVLTLPSVGNTSFNLGITATAQEVSNSDQETNTIFAPIGFENKENDYTPSFLATNQSIWDSGNAVTFTNNTFIGIDGGDSGSGGTGDPPHSDDLLSWSYDAHVKAGFQSNLSFNGGTITANLNYNLGVDTHYNKTTDTLLITSSKLLTGGDFTTVGPQGHYKLDFIFNYDIAAKVAYNIGVDSGNIIDIHPTYNSTTNIIDLDSSDLSVGFDFPDPFGSLSATLAWPNIATDANSSSPPPGEFSSNGASNNFFTLTLDVDQALADIILKGANPFAIPFDIPLLVDGTIELADLDLSGGLNFLQTFVMQEQPLTAKLKFEDGTEQAFTFGTDLVLPNAKLIDQGGDNDGNVEFQLLMDAQATLHNDTDLGFNVGYNFDLMKIDYDAGVLGSGTIGPLFSTGGTLPLGSVGVYDNTFGLNFADQSVFFGA